MRVARQIGWSQESELIYQIIKQTERINQLLPGNQPAANTTRVSKQIGWSNESNLYYEWLRSLDKLTQHYSNCCPTIGCGCYQIISDIPTSSSDFLVTPCNGGEPYYQAVGGVTPIYVCSLVTPTTNDNSGTATLEGACGEGNCGF